MITMRSMLLCALMAALPLATGASEHKSELDAVNKLIDDYGAYQAASDALGMSKLMATDRVCLSQHFGGRRTDNVLNMKIQQAQLDIQNKEVPGIRDYVEDRERLIRFLGDGRVAAVSFFRYITRVFPPGTSAEMMKKYAADPPLAISLVLEKRGEQWIIVHTHASELTAAH
jgi:ketosteroid isomerase-like protein